MAITFAAACISTFPRQTPKAWWVGVVWVEHQCLLLHPIHHIKGKSVFQSSRADMPCIACESMLGRTYFPDVHGASRTPEHLGTKLGGNTASFPGPTKRGEGLVHTACACTRGPRKMWGTGYQRIRYHIFPCDALPWRSGTCASSVYQALSPLFVGPGNEARGNTVCAAYQLTGPQTRALSSLYSST